MGRHNNYHQPYSASNYIIFLEDKIEKQNDRIEELEAYTETLRMELSKFVPVVQITPPVEDAADAAIRVFKDHYPTP